MYNFLLRSDFVNGHYAQIRREEKKAGTARHDLVHVLNVVSLIESVLAQLNAKVEYIEAAKIAALLHDVGCIHGKKGHAMKSFEMVNAYLDQKKLNIFYQDEVLDAIKNHGSTFDSDSLMTQALIMCDKIDLTKQRLAPEGFETVGIRQLQYIEDVAVVIANDECHVAFSAHHDLDLHELNAFKFLDKTFQAIASFATWNQLKPVVTLNGAQWSREGF